MTPFPLDHVFTLIEPGPVTLVTTHGGAPGAGRDNVMTITWTMALEFGPRFAITTGPWNHSWAALRDTGQCVVAVPPAEMIDTVISVGTTSGAQIDKFARFGLARAPATQVAAPLLPDCLANIECRVDEIIEPHGIVILQGLAAWTAPARCDRRTLHAVGDGTFVVDGDRLDRRAAMRSKLPEGV